MSFINSILQLPLPRNFTAGVNLPLENTDLNPSGKRNGLDIFATWQLTEKIQLAFNYDYITQNKATLPYNVLSNAVWTGATGLCQLSI